MKKSRIAAAIAAAFFAVSGASAATVEMSGNNDRVFTLINVTDATLSFAVPSTGGYENFGGYVRWSTREDGWTDDAGSWGTCLECGYAAGNWAVVFDPWEVVNNLGIVNPGRGTDPSRPSRDNRRRVSDTPSTSELFVDFSGARETVYLWVNPTYGTGTVSLVTNAATADVGSADASMSAVPLPAGAWLLITAVGSIVMLRRRKTG